MSNQPKRSMRNLWRMLAFDIAAPLAAIGGLVMVGVVLRWPAWWISACSVLILLIVEGVVVNFVRLRRESVTVGTDDAGPRLRLAVAALCLAALVAAVVLGYTRWTIPDRDFERDSAEVVQIAADVAQETATVNASSPTASIDKAVQRVAPEQAQAFKERFEKIATNLASHNVNIEASVITAGVEALGQNGAKVAVVLHSTQSTWDQPPKTSVVPARVTLRKENDRWLVLDVSPIQAR